MNSRQRFLETMHFGHPGRVPYFEEGIRKEVLQAWRKQGLAAQADLAKMFATDEREEIRLDVDIKAATRIVNALTIGIGDSQLLPYLNIYLQVSDESMPAERVLNALSEFILRGIGVE